MNRNLVLLVMSSSLFLKLRIFLRAIKILKNWQLYPRMYFHRINDNYAIFETKTGVKIKLRVDSSDFMAFTNVWLVEDYYRPKFEIKSDDTIIDIGSHIGLFALYASQFCTRGTIFCFEPVKENYDLLQENLKLNNIKNVIAFNLAVSGVSSFVSLFLNDDKSAHSIHTTSPNEIKVESRSLKDIIDENEIKICNFVKIDCEGAEYEILGRLPQNYFSKIEKMVIEYHLADYKPELLSDLLGKLMTSFDVTKKEFYDGMGILFALKK